MKALKVTGIALIAVGVIAASGWLLLKPGARAAADAEPLGPTAVVSLGAIEETVSATGSVSADHEAHLVLTTGGRVANVFVDDGAQVEPGATLLTLEADTLERQVARAQASLATAMARLEQAKLPASEAEIAQAEARVAQARRPATEAELAAVRASVDAAQANLDRALNGATQYEIESAKLSVDSARNQLWSVQAQRDATKGNRMSSDAQKDSSEAQVLVAEVAVQQALVAQERLLAPARAEDIAAAQAQVNQAKAQLQQTMDRPKAEDVALAEAQLAQTLERPRAEDVAVAQAQVDEAALALAQAQEALGDLELTAPFAGTVVSIAVDPGEWAMSGSPVVHLADTEHLVLEIMLDEADVAQVAEGQQVRLTFDALPKQEVRGAVSRIASAATQTSGGVAYAVETRFEAGNLPVRLGMSARVDIVTAHVEDALLVPNQAIEADREAGRYYVNRKTLLGAERVEIQIGLRDDSFTQIVGGLAAGDELVLQIVQAQEEEGFGFMPPMPPGAQR